ncbi:hypothetical protein HB762_26915 (plasmid) [Vibrio campbellii]|uniref:Uncharacterized protein n=1 Tax=Vibrio campbellii TaxID=680 RepID=A0ABY5IME1_9VIBR|nr:hypothetical protein [Vibrio campbellii]UTZ34896.1 hypothetical protein HB762_26915 [Vibrio campbellii]
MNDSPILNELLLNANKAPTATNSKQKLIINSYASGDENDDESYEEEFDSLFSQEEHAYEVPEPASFGMIEEYENALTDASLQTSDSANAKEDSKITSKKIKSLQMKSLKTLTYMINAELANAGRTIVRNKAMMDQFQDGIVNAIGETVLLQKEFIVSFHKTVCDLNKVSERDKAQGKSSASEYSYRLSWGINSLIYARSVEIGYDAKKSTKLFTQILLGIYGDINHPGIVNIRNQLGLTDIDPETLAYIDRRMDKVRLYNPFREQQTSNEESFYYSVSMAWSEVFNALHSDRSVIVDGNARNTIRKMFEDRIIDLFAYFSVGCERESDYNMLLKSCISKVASFQANIINICIDSLKNDSNQKSFGFIISTTRDCLDELVSRLKFCTEVVTRQLLEAETGSLVHGVKAHESEIYPTHLLLNIDNSIDNYISSIKPGLLPNDIAQRYLMLQRTTLKVCDIAQDRFRHLVSYKDQIGANGQVIKPDMNVLMPGFYGKVYNAFKNANSHLPVFEESAHQNYLTAILGAAIMALMPRVSPDKVLCELGFDPYLKREVNEQIVMIARALKIEPTNHRFNAELLCASIEAISSTRTFAWGIHEGYVALNVVNSLLKASNNIFRDSPIQSNAESSFFSFKTALDQSLKIFKRIWSSTANETLTRSDKRFCLGDIDRKSAEDIINEFNRTMSQECYLFHSNAEKIYNNLLGHKSINLNFKKTSDLKPGLSEEEVHHISMGFNKDVE